MKPKAKGMVFISESLPFLELLLKEFIKKKNKFGGGRDVDPKNQESWVQ